MTGLANRTLFKERLHQAGQRARQSGRSLALLHIDLDRFKILNDSLGHELADQLLRQMSRRLAQTIPEAETLARLSGDEFAVLLDSYGSLSSLARLASRVLSKLRLPIMVGDQELVVSASIGISLLPDNAREISTLLSQANMAVQHAKHLGGNTFQFYTDNLQACTLERLQLENQLRKGIEEGQLEVFYQPKLCLADDSLHAAEALVRWRHPELGLVPPGDFIGLAEETGLINPLGEFILYYQPQFSGDGKRLIGADQRAVGLRQPHLRHPRARVRPGQPPGGKPRAGRRRQPLPGHGDHAGLRLPRHDGAARAHRTHDLQRLGRGRRQPRHRRSLHLSRTARRRAIVGA